MSNGLDYIPYYLQWRLNQAIGEAKDEVYPNLNKNQKIRFLKAEINELQSESRKYKNLTANRLDNSWIIYQRIHQDLEIKKQKLMKDLKLLEYQNKTQPKGWITQTDIEIAKQVPILDFVDHHGPIRKRMLVLCIFHSDKTPSCTLYTDQNTFNCYSCSANGDVISWVQHKYQYKFMETVRFLLHK